MKRILLIVNGVPISELQAFASEYGINHVRSIRFPDHHNCQGRTKKLKDIYVVYLNHSLPRRCVARNRRLEEEMKLRDDDKS